MILTFVVDERLETRDAGLKVTLRPFGEGLERYASWWHLGGKVDPEVNELQLGEVLRITVERINAEEPQQPSQDAPGQPILGPVAV